MNFLTNLFGRLLFVAVICLVVFSVGCSAEADKSAAMTQLVVYKNPRCGCCEKWVSHMQTAGFDLAIGKFDDMSEVKRRFGIQPQYQSCHTAVSEADGYVFEGHIPASVIQQFLAAPPENAMGLVVPGMPVGSPGMEVRGRSGRYDVLLLKSDGDVEVFSSIDGHVEI